MLVTKREGFAIKNENEISLRADASSQQQTSATQTTPEIVKNPSQTKAASDFANGKKFDDRFQANLLKDHLGGLEKQSTKFVGENVGVIKDNLGKDIVRHDGPGISDLFNMGRKQGLGGSDPFAGQPSVDHGKKLPDMPYRKNDPSLFMFGELDERQRQTALEQTHRQIADHTGDKSKEWVDHLKKSGVYAADEFAKKKTNENENKYVDPDHTDCTQIDKPAEPPAGAHDRLGHKLDAGNNLVPEYDAKGAIQAHKDRDNSLVYKDPDQQPIEATIDASNPPSSKGEELKNTGNPIDNNSLRPAPRPKQGGDKPYTDGESGIGVRRR